MSNYLDDTGLEYFNQKIKDEVYHSLPHALIVNLSITYNGGSVFTGIMSESVSSIYNYYGAGIAVILKPSDTSVPACLLTQCTRHNSGTYTVVFKGFRAKEYCFYASNVSSSTTAINGQAPSTYMPQVVPKGRWVWFGNHILQAGLSSKSPYWSTVTNRAVVFKSCMTPPSWATSVRVTVTGSSSYNVAVWLITGSGVSDISSGTQMTSGTDYIDSGWLTNGSSYSLSTHSYLWVNIKQTDGADFDASTISKVEVQYI